MNVRDPGHDYVLASLDGDAPQRLTFVKREGAGFPGNVGAHPGTTMQEVLRALIDRAEYVNGQIPCAETEAGIRLMQSALLLFELRAARRHERIFPAFDTLNEAMVGAACARCGHVGCDGCGGSPPSEASESEKPQPILGPNPMRPFPGGKASERSGNA